MNSRLNENKMISRFILHDVKTSEKHLNLLHSCIKVSVHIYRAIIPIMNLADFSLAYITCYIIWCRALTDVQLVIKSFKTY